MEARCLHFGLCGGCSLQDRGYPEQLRLKGERVARILVPFGLEPGKVHPSPELWYYRNKMEFSFGDVHPPVPGGPGLLLGLKPKGRWHQILDLRECHLLSPEAPALLASVREWAGRERILPYNSRRHAGFLRHLVVREAKNRAERMVSLVTAPGALPLESFSEAVRGAYPATTILWGVNGKLSDTAVPDSLQVLEGPGHVTELLRLPEQSLRFRISPQSFFQTNTGGAEVLYGILRSWVREAGGRVLDLYCGGGGISLSVSGVASEVIGVELSTSAVEDARANAALNGIANARFYCGSVEILLPALLDMRPEVVIADPPRAGLHPKAQQILREEGPGTLLYVSCNPEAMGRDLEALSPGYRPRRAEVVDLFPHTDHVETLVWLSRAPRVSLRRAED